jgi:hypothetical protein
MTAARLVLAAAVLLGAAAGALPSASATTTAPTDAVAIRLSTMTPLVPGPGDTLTITGVATNDTDDTVSDVSVRLRLSPTPVRDRDEIQDILSGNAGRTGIAIDATTAPVAGELEPGASVTFTLAAELDDLGLSGSFPQVVVLGVEVLADTDGDGSTTQAGFVRVPLPWFPDPALVDPTRVVWLYPLSSAPTRLAPSLFLDDTLGAAVAAGGRLTRLLDAGVGAPTSLSWVVDPALLEALADMADGYEVQAPDGTRTAGTGAGAAVLFLDRLRALPVDAEVTASAYADPDVVALHRVGLDVDIALASTTAADLPEQLFGRPVGGGLAWPANGLSDEGTLEVLRASGSRAVVLSAASLPPEPAVPYTPSGSVELATGGSPLRAVAFDPEITGLVSRARPALDPVVRRQTALAEIAMMTLELPTTARTLVIAPGMRWAPAADGVTAEVVTALADAPYATPSRLGALLADPPSEVERGRTDYPASARRAELSGTYLDSVARARADLAGLRQVAPDTGGGSIAELESALTRAESAAWRIDRVTGRRLVATTAATTRADIDQVRVLTTAPVTLPGESGIIPVTVSNDLDRQARVGVRLTGSPDVRFDADDIAPVTLAPGQKVTLEVAARVLGTGPVEVAGVLLTPEGEPFGTPATFEVRSAAYARAAQWVVIALFGILVVLLGANFVRRRRRPAPSGASEPAPASVDPGERGAPS